MKVDVFGNYGPKLAKTSFSEKSTKLKMRDNLTVQSSAMFAKRGTDESDLRGLKLSAGLLVALGTLWGLCALLSASMLVITVFRAFKERADNVSDARFLLTSALVILITSVLAWLCIRAAKALNEARQWGAYVAMTFGLLLLIFTGSVIYDMYHPHRQSADEYFGILVVPFTLVVGLWWCIYLNLAHVRRRLANTRSQ